MPYLFRKSEESENSSQIIHNCSDFSPHKIEDTVQPTSATLKLTGGKELDSMMQNDEDFKELPSLDISKRKEEIKKKLTELRNKVETKNLKQSVDEDFLLKAVVKIQALVRGWMVRVAVKKFGKYLVQSESWESFQPALMSESEEESESGYESREKSKIKTQVDIEYVEVFDGGDMLTTDKTTMGTKIKT